MIGAKQLYHSMAKVSQRYSKLKGLFDQFCNLANSHLTSEQCQVKGIVFNPDLESNRFCVTFVGTSIVFFFTFSQDEQACVTCSKVSPMPEGSETTIGSFSFNGQADTNLRTPEEEDVLGIDTEASAGFLVLHFLNEALQKK